MDIQLVGVSSPDVIMLDWLQGPITGQIVDGPSLQAAVFVALLSDAIAAPSDVLPDPNSDDLRGWWGDLDAQEIWGAWPLGSKLWLLTRTSIVDQNARAGATITRVQKYLAAALQPFVDNKICSKFTVTARQTNIQTIISHVKIYRGPKSAIALEFQALWNEQIAAVPLPAPLPPALTGG
jgi:phage gp46-like protein